MMKRKELLKSAFCVIATLILVAGCSTDNGIGPVAQTSESVKFGALKEAVKGLKITQTGNTVASVREAVVEGKLTVLKDQDSQVFEVEFIDKNGERLSLNEKFHKLTWQHTDSEIAEFEQYEELKEWQFHINGKKSGDTTFELCIKDIYGILQYSSPSIALEVQ